MKNPTLDKIRSLVEKNNLKKALDIISKELDNAIHSNDFSSNAVILLKRKLEVWNQAFISGAEPQEIEKTKIAFSILLIVDSLKNKELGKEKIEEILRIDKPENKFRKIENTSYVISFLAFTITLLLFFLSYFSYNNMKLSNNNLKILNSNKKEKVYEEISEVIGKRLYRTIRQIDFYSNPEGHFEKRRISLINSYGEVIDEWNSNLSKNANMLEFNFGKEFRIEFDEIHTKFKSFHNDIKESIGTGEFDYSNIDLEKLSNVKEEITDFANHTIEPFINGICEKTK